MIGRLARLSYGHRHAQYAKTLSWYAEHGAGNLAPETARSLLVQAVAYVRCSGAQLTWRERLQTFLTTRRSVKRMSDSEVRDRLVMFCQFSAREKE